MTQSLSRENSGFTTFSAVLLTGVIVIIVAVAFFVVRSHHKPVTPAKPSTTSHQAQATTKPTNPCLTFADLRSYAYLPITKVAQDTPISRVYFEPDTTDYNPTLMPGSKPVGASEYQLYQSSSGKDYRFTITASTSEESTSEAGQQLAAARAEKVKKEMIARGIPADKIITLSPTHGLAGGDLTRYAYIGVRVPKSCVTQ